MSEDNNVFEEKSEKANDKIESNNIVDDIFGGEPEKPEEPENKQKKQKEPVKEVNKSQEAKASEKKVDQRSKDSETNSSENEKKSIEKDDEDESDHRSAEIEKLKKLLNDSQKWGHTNNRRLKGVQKTINSLKDQGVLNEDDFDNLSTLLASDPEEEERMTSVASNNPIANLIKIAGSRVEDLREIYEDDTLFDKKIASFDFFINHSSAEEKEEMLDELEDFKGNPLKLAKKMYQIGEKFYNDGYNELDEAGGLKQFISSRNKKIENMKQKLDKLEKKLLQYEDYDKPTYKVEESGDTSNLVKNKGYDSFVDEIFGERDRNIGR